MNKIVKIPHHTVLGIFNRERHVVNDAKEGESVHALHDIVSILHFQTFSDRQVLQSEEMISISQCSRSTSVISTSGRPSRAFRRKPYADTVAGVYQTLNTKPATGGQDVVIRIIIDVDPDRLHIFIAKSFVRQLFYSIREAT